MQDEEIDNSQSNIENDSADNDNIDNDNDKPIVDEPEVEKTEYELLIDTMVSSLKRKCEQRNLDYIDEETYIDEIYDAISATNERRRFDATPEMPFEKKYERLIVKLALASITKYGAEGETAHSENGINRSYDNSSEYPEALLSRIVPLAKAR